MNDIRDAAVHFEAVKTSMSQSKQGTILRLAIHPNEVPPSLHTDWVGSRYMVAMVKLDDNDQPDISDEQREVNKLVSVAGMLCRNNDFADFLHQNGYMNDDDYLNSNYGEDEGIVANSLRQHLGISSRSDLKTNSVAREKFKGLVSSFEMVKKGRTPDGRSN